MNNLRQAAQQALEALESRCGTNAEERGPAGAITALRAALADGDNLAPTGCNHCNHPLYAAIKCRRCGRVTG